MPASAWFQGVTGPLDITAFIETALAGVTLTAAPPGIAVVPRTLFVNYFRPARPEAGNLLARGRVVHASSFFAFTELEIEDPEGRHIIHAAGQSEFRPVDPPPPPPPARLAPIDEPLYPTPDPYLRSVPVAPPADWERQGGLAFMRGYLDGTRVMPLAELYGMRLLEVDEGRAVTTLAASEWFGFSELFRSAWPHGSAQGLTQPALDGLSPLRSTARSITRSPCPTRDTEGRLAFPAHSWRKMRR
jgi:hypothetical protein